MPRLESSSGSAENAAYPEARDLDWSILMARAQDGDTEAYRRLLEQITPYLRHLASKRHRDPRDIEDSVQDILLTVHVIRQTYDPSRPFGPWLVAIANRRIFDRLRRRIREIHREEAFEPDQHIHSKGPSEINALADRKLLEDAIQNLPPTQQTAVRMLKLEEMSLKEASARSGLSTTSLKVATHRAMKGLRKILGGGGE
ncbi:MAG: sigma-70 family RNA polymerase sigma factor [Edaphobacter sp.]|uniref:sigma-70 family RNA polymerase sigma factor n=1 Tax=Edaphobacter sp. TaxID=1934404 RepID=UPI0023897F15|nr:sigma-70 family RNA polymerase sigma factor [Edaphobacter sp.]MDE1175604.1 sigma-70 family RNA polymerase sigma factor [Edaphobacter sp.]